MRVAPGRGPLLLVVLLLGVAVSPVAAGHQAPGPEAIGYGPAGLIHAGHGWPACGAFPYCTSSGLYGYPDYAYGRGPLINLGGAALQGGFRGYGMFGSPGYGLGLRPSTWIDLRSAPWHGLRDGHGLRFSRQ